MGVGMRRPQGPAVVLAAAALFAQFGSARAADPAPPPAAPSLFVAGDRVVALDESGARWAPVAAPEAMTAIGPGAVRAAAAIPGGQRLAVFVLDDRGRSALFRVGAGVPDEDSEILRMSARADGLVAGEEGGPLYAWGAERAGGGFVARIDLATKAADRMALAQVPVGLALSPDGARAWVALPDSIQSVGLAHWTLSWGFRTPPGRNRSVVVLGTGERELVCAGRDGEILCFSPHDPADRGALPVRARIERDVPTDGFALASDRRTAMAWTRGSASVARLELSARGDAIRTDSVAAPATVAAAAMTDSMDGPARALALLQDGGRVVPLDATPEAAASLVEIETPKPPAPPPAPVEPEAPKTTAKPETVPAPVPPPVPVKPTAETKPAPPAPVVEKPAAESKPAVPPPVVEKPAAETKPAPSASPLPEKSATPAPVADKPVAPPTADKPAAPPVPPPAADRPAAPPVPPPVAPAVSSPAQPPPDMPRETPAIDGPVVAGRVSGTPPGPIEVVLFGPDSLLHEAAVIPTPAGGEFRTPSLAPGRYRVTVRSTSRATVSVTPSFRMVTVAADPVVSVDFEVASAPVKPQ